MNGRRNASPSQSWPITFTRNCTSVTRMASPSTLVRDRPAADSHMVYPDTANNRAAVFARPGRMTLAFTVYDGSGLGGVTCSAWYTPGSTVNDAG